MSINAIILKLPLWLRTAFFKNQCVSCKYHFVSDTTGNVLCNERIGPYTNFFSNRYCKYKKRKWRTLTK